MNRTMFDATIDFNGPYALENELQAALDSLQVCPGDMFGVHIPADGENCEHGELVVGENLFSRDIKQDDWLAVGTNVAELAAELRRLMNQN